MIARLISAWGLAAHPVVSVAVLRMEVEHEDEISPLTHDHLVPSVLATDPRVIRVAEAKRLVQMVHCTIKRGHVLVFQRVRVGEVPASAALVIAPVVA